ncbi:MAG: hypothetical protein IJX40_05200 [Alistipes sp.]|nr:hypothetical protein [Alistipes sp.]
MILDITRHKFFEGFATLLLFAIVTTIATGISHIPIETDVATNAAPLGALIRHFAARHSVLSIIALAPIFVYAVLRLARATARASLYPQGTLAAISLGAIVLMALIPSAEYAMLSIVALLACEAVGRLLYCFGPNIRAHHLFTAMLALGTLPLVDGVLVPIVAVVALLTILLRGTLREAIITLVGVFAPLFICCYIEWLMMGDFGAPLEGIKGTLLAASYTSIIGYITLPRLIFLGTLIALALLSIILYFTNRVSLGSGARNVWFVLLMSIVTLTASMLLGYISPSIIIVMSIVIVPMLPMLFVCITPLLSVATYILFILTAIVALL